LGLQRLAKTYTSTAFEAAAKEANGAGVASCKRVKGIILKTAVAGPKTAHPAKITAAFEFPVLTLTVPGFRAENIKILCAFNQLHPFSPPF
jgi:hypothetical protein